MLGYLFFKIKKMRKDFDRLAFLETQDANLASEYDLKNIAEAIPQIVWTAKADGNLDYYNQKWFDYTGMNLEQTKDWGWAPVIHPDDLQNCIALWTQAVKTGEPYEVEYRFKRASDGVYRWHLGRAKSVRDSHDIVIKWFGTCTDIHEQKTISVERTLHAARELATTEIKRSKEFLDQIINNLPTMVFVKDAKDLKYIRINKAIEEFLNCTEADFLGKSDHDFFAKEQAESYESNDRAVLASGGKTEIREVQIQTPAKGMRSLRSKIMALSGPGGEEYILGISEDVTDQKNIEEAIRQSNSELEKKIAERTHELAMLAETIPHLVWIISGDGKALYFNQRWIEYTGTSIENPSTWEDIIHQEDIPGSKSAWEESMQTGQAYSVEYRIRRTDGTFRWHLTRGLPILDVNSKVVKWFGTCTDIHDQKEIQFDLNKTQAELQAIANRLNTAVLESPFPIMLHAEDGEILLVSKAWTEYSGYTIQDIPTISDWTEKAYGEKGGFLKSYIDDLFKLKSKVHNGEFTISAKSGEKRTWDFFTAPLGILADGRRLLISSATDVTERISAQESLMDSESQFRTLANSMPHLAWMAHPDGANYWYNQGWYDYTGTKTGEMDGSRWVSLQDPLILPQVLEKWSEALKAGNLFEMEFPLLGKDGIFRWFLTRVSPVRNKAGEITKWFGTATDVDQQRILLNAVETQKNRLQRLVSASVIGVAFSDSEGNIADGNDAFLKIVGYSRTDLEAGKVNRKTITPAEDSFSDRKEVQEFLKSGTCSPFEKNLIRKDGVQVPVLIGVTDLKGDRTDCVSWILDLSNQKATEKERSDLIVSEKTALESSKIKSEFLANMSHEIRTPINGVIGMTSLLLDTELNIMQRDYGETIRSSADTLLTLVNDILDLSKAEAGKIDLEIINFDLDQVVGDIERTLGFAAKKKGLKLLKSVATDLPAYLRGDPTRLRQVLSNLVNNAIKFTSRGSVTVEVNNETVAGNQIQLRFEVSDTGIGIPEESLSRMFQAFSQADASTTRKFGGTGLGLSISKHLVTLMGGEIGVKSTAGMGSTFWFTLPFEMGSQLLGEASSAEFANIGLDRKLRILIAEDNSINQIIAIAMLEKLGHTAVAVANGSEAIDALRETPYDLIFMDCQMPELDGYEATKIIRNSKTLTWQNIPIIAMTANAMSGDREKCLKAGMTDYLSKPMKPKDLALAIERNITTKSKTA